MHVSLRCCRQNQLVGMPSSAARSTARQPDKFEDVFVHVCFAVHIRLQQCEASFGRLLLQAFPAELLQCDWIVTVEVVTHSDVFAQGTVEGRSVRDSRCPCRTAGSALQYPGAHLQHSSRGSKSLPCFGHSYPSVLLEGNLSVFVRAKVFVAVSRDSPPIFTVTSNSCFETWRSWRSWLFERFEILLKGGQQ